MTPLEKYYGKFKEDHRLTTRHGLVEFNTSMKFLHYYIEEIKSKSAESVNPAPVKIVDVGAGTGRYSVVLAEEGHDVTAVELVPHNLQVLESKHANVKCWPGNAMDLSFLPDETFDITIMFGPMYHLLKKEERLKAFEEAKRITKKGGYIFVQYVMNEYSVLTYCFKEGHIQECLDRKSLTEDFKQIPTEKDLYVYLRLEDMDALNQETGLKLKERFAADGPSDYMRQILNAMDENTFQRFMEYHYATCRRPELLGASSHVVDILQKA
jgi:ubiquinone/menaquinone biosynthesis C-methylase UbiE